MPAIYQLIRIKTKANRELLAHVVRRCSSGTCIGLELDLMMMKFGSRE